MPLYDFECNTCGHRFEVRMSVGEEPPKRCPKKGCRGHVHKVFSPPAIIFKGSGFHVNDYSSTGPKSAGNSRVPAKSEAKAASGTDAKPSSGATADKPTMNSPKSDG
jgi:putative FmdB family regulatory protein